jgi:hypothetical protein
MRTEFSQLPPADVPTVLRLPRTRGASLKIGTTEGRRFSLSAVKGGRGHASVRFGSKADIKVCSRDVRFYPQKRTFQGTVTMSALCQKETFRIS